MSAYLYTAIDPRGRKRRGVIEASSTAAARAQLRSQALVPTSLHETTRKPVRATLGQAAPWVLFAPRRDLSARRLALLTRQLAMLIGAGVRIEDALAVAARQGGTPRETSLLLNLRSAVLDGQSFAAALADYPGTFGTYFRTSVRAGESAGQLASVMEHLAQHVEEQAKNRQTLQLALIYPALLTLVSLSVVIALMTFVLPDIVRVFTARGAELPGLTRGLIGLSDWLQLWGLPVLVTILTAGMIGLAALRRPNMERAWHGMLLSAPLVGAVIRRVNASRFTATLSTLVSSGVPLTEALQASVESTRNRAVREMFNALAKSVSEGASLSRAAEDSGLFPPMLIAMISSGEVSGTLDRSLERSAQDQAAELRARIATVVGLVEPAVLLMMGGLVMTLVLAILLPIVGLNDLVGR